jgi:hypothetical protein
MVMTPLPDHEPDIALNGLLEASAGDGAARPMRLAAAMARTGFTRFISELTVENIVCAPLDDFPKCLVEMSCKTVHAAAEKDG